MSLNEQLRNPCGLDGFAFLEFSGNKNTLHKQFHSLGFRPVAKLKDFDITLYNQGNINFILNAEKNCQAYEHAKIHGEGACAMGFKVKNVDLAFKHAIAKGANIFIDDNNINHRLPAIKAIGGSVIYFTDDNNKVFNNAWEPLTTENPGAAQLQEIDHLTHNVNRGNMDKWAKFYENIFNFYEIKYFDISGKMTGLVSRALASPCGKIKIPLNESKDANSQIEEFLKEYNGEGIQHIALSTKDIYKSINTLHKNGVNFLDVPATYYEMIADRIPWHQEPLELLQAEKILIDGGITADKGLLLQIFTENIFGPVFFEIIQRKGNDGFGEGNFQALFEAIERDQIKRGTL